MATIQDVARRSGVSTSTVSYVINGTRPISAATAERVRAAIAELGYRPNAFARGLASRRTRCIGLMFPTPSLSLGSTALEFVTAVADSCRAAGYQVLLWTTEVHQQDELKALIGAGQVDGVIVMEVRSSEDRIALLDAAGMPYALIGRPAAAGRLPYVDIDFDATIGAALEHLTGLGHRAIGLLSGAESDDASQHGPSRRVVQAFDAAIAARGLIGRTRPCEDTPDAGREAFTALLSDCPDLTALISMRDLAMVGVLDAVEHRGWSVPADFSLLAILCSSAVAALSRPRLTALVPQIKELSETAVGLLVSRIEDRPRARRPRLLPSTLHPGSSTGPAAR